MPSARHMAIALAVPMLASVVFGRQVYLQYFSDLSAWKGGGMGMFASLDAPRQRYLKIYISDPLGQRVLVDRFSPRQRRLITAARIEPADRNFNALSADLLASRWVLRREMVEIYQVDQSGSPLSALPERRLAVAPAVDLPSSTGRLTLGNAWYPAEVTIEFWKIGYDVADKRLSANLVSVFEDRQRGSGD